jgi:outer membrane protein assembly factor BamE (lipoprotein component of BamABCDE complex)
MKRLLLPALLTLAALTGCATPENRIKDNPGVYSTLTPAQQELVKKGEIALDMPEAGVQLALGKPDRVTEHTDASGQQHVWHYTQVQNYGPAVAYPSPFFYPYQRFYDPFFFPGAYYGPTTIQTETDRIRVIFKDGKVTAIEREL